MKSIILLSMSLILCGCTTSQDKVAAESSNIETEVVRSASGYKCEQEIITGTKFKKSAVVQVNKSKEMKLKLKKC